MIGSSRIRTRETCSGIAREAGSRYCGTSAKAGSKQRRQTSTSPDPGAGQESEFP